MEGESAELAAAPAAGGADASGIALAFGAAAPSERVAARAETFLEKQAALTDRQSALVEYQTEELRRGIHLHHWSMRVRHISDVIKLSFEFSMAVILLALAALVVGAAWSAMHDTSAVIEAFSVPPDMATRGITGEVVASKLLARLSVMQAQTESTRAASNYAGNWGNEIKVQIPDTGISIGDFIQFLHCWLGRQTRITGNVYRTANGIAVTARAGDQTSPTFTGHEADLDSLVDQVARSVYRATQPYRYARYLTGLFTKNPMRSTDFSEGLAILSDLTHVGTPEDRAWAYDGLGKALIVRGDFLAVAAMMRKSIAIRPGLDAYDTLASAEKNLGHDEEAVKAFSSAIEMARKEQTFGIDPSLVPQIVLGDKRNMTLLFGNYSEALGFGRALHDLAAQSNASPSFDSYAYASDAAACAGLHDAGCLRRARESYAGSPLNALDVLEAEVNLGHFEHAAAQLASVREWLTTLPVGFAEFINRRFIQKDRALFAANTGNFTEAWRLVGASPVDCYGCLRARGKIDARAHHWDAAAWWFNIAAVQSPSLPFAWTDWGEMLLCKGDYDSAIAKFATAHAKGPRFADPLEMWGEALMQKNRSDLALAKFEVANKYAPNWARLHFKWGEALMYAGKKDEARKQFKIGSHLDLAPADKAELGRVMHG